MAALLKVIAYAGRADSLQAPPAPPAAPVVASSLIPAGIRRRSSALTNSALEVALELVQQGSPDYCIFASRHGEIDHTVELLSAISRRETLSPTSFSQSVHNTASGLFTIVEKSPYKVTSMAAGAKTFDMALLEASAYLKNNPEHKVMVIAFDQILPEFYQENLDEESVPFAFGILLSHLEEKPIAQEIAGIDGSRRRPRPLIVMDEIVSKKSSILAYSESSQQWWALAAN